MHNRDHHLTSAEHIVTPNSMYYADENGFLVEIPLPTDGSGGYLRSNPVDNIPGFAAIEAVSELSNKRFYFNANDVCTVDLDLSLSVSFYITFGATTPATAVLNFINIKPLDEQWEHHVSICLRFMDAVSTFTWALDGTAKTPKTPYGIALPVVKNVAKLNRYQAVVTENDLEVYVVGTDIY